MAVARRISSVFKPGLFKDKVAIVTGGATGIGRAISEELLYLGCKVVVASRKLDRLSKGAEEMKSIPNRHPSSDILHKQCNIRQETEVKELMQFTLDNYGKIDFLVNNGGGQFPAPISEISLKGWNAVIETNLTGTYLCCREAYQKWMGEHGGVIVNIVVDNFRGMPLMGHSGAARAGVENLTKTMALEWAENGVRINAVAPGTIYSSTAAAHYDIPDIFEATIPNIPAKRLGHTAEVVSIRLQQGGQSKLFCAMLTMKEAAMISGAVCFLLSPAASFISGATLRIDAGSSLYKHPRFEIPDHKPWPSGEADLDESDNPPSKL